MMFFRNKKNRTYPLDTSLTEGLLLEAFVFARVKVAGGQP